MMLRKCANVCTPIFRPWKRIGLEHSSYGGYAKRSGGSYVYRPSRTPLEETRIVERELVEDYLAKSGMPHPQADTLSRILADMEARLATKEDLAHLKADLTWRMIAVVGLFGTLVTLLNAYIS